MTGLEAFYRSAYKPLFRTAMRLGASTPEQAKDVVSEAMVDLVRNWDRIDEPRAWATKAVRTNLIKIKRREAQQQQTSTSGYAVPEAHHDMRLNDCEEHQEVESLLDTLPPAQRVVMSLTTHGLRLAEIAAVLGISQPGVRKNLERARTRLKAVVRQRYHPAAQRDQTTGGDDVNDRC